MYCWHCGKEIEDSDTFCKYCGKKVTIDSEPLVYRNYNKWERFNELSKPKQIIIILYAVYVLIWFFAILDDEESRFRFLFPSFFLWTIVIPFVLVALWYIYKICKKSNEDSNVEQNTQSFYKENVENTPTKSNAEILSENSVVKPQTKSSNKPSELVFSEMLIQFARQNGRMQLVRKEIPNGQDDCYCKFTSADGNEVRVEFSDRTRGLSPKEISENKYNLSVNKFTDGHFCLDYLDAGMKDSQN